MKRKFTALFIIIILFFIHALYAQQQSPADYYSRIKSADLSKLWFNDPYQERNDSSPADLPEPLGFIGENYQRFFIHLTSVKKSRTNPYLYSVIGKTKVSGNICRFTGTINILHAELSEEKFEGKYRQGIVLCDILFYEDSLRPATGVYKGQLSSKFYLDELNRLWYDDLELGADGFRNNQCETVWTSYATGKSKKCNWGDYRIPQSKALDSGDGEFSVSKKYDAFGWKNYRIAWSDDPWKKGTGQAREAENKQWW